MTVFVFLCKKWQPSVYDFLSSWLLRINLRKLTSVVCIVTSQLEAQHWISGVLTNVLAWSMFWRGRWFGIVNVLALSLAWRWQCFGTVNVLARSIFYNGLCFGAVAQMPASDNPWGTSYIKSNFYTDCTKILTAPKHRPNRYTDNDGPKGHLVYFIYY